MDAAKGLDFYSKRVDDTFKHRWQDGSKWISIWTLRFMAKDGRFRSRGFDKSLMRDSCCSIRQSSPEYIHTYFFFSPLKYTEWNKDCYWIGRNGERQRGRRKHLAFAWELSSPSMCAGCEIFFRLYSYSASMSLEKLPLRIWFFVYEFSCRFAINRRRMKVSKAATAAYYGFWY